MDARYQRARRDNSGRHLLLEILTDVFVSRNRSKGASIDDRSAREREMSGGEKKTGGNERTGEGWRASSRRVYLSSKQKMRVRRRRREESQQQRREKETTVERGWNDAPSRRRAQASIVYLPTATQYSFAKGCEGPPRPKGRCRRHRAAPFRNRTLTVADESILRVFASLRANFSQGAPVRRAP